MVLSWLHPSIILKESRISGKGLFAVEFIPKDTVVWRENPNNKGYRMEEILTWPKEKQTRFFSLMYQIGEGIYDADLETDDPACYMNHSCDPNTWFIDDLVMSARRDINPNEEVTYDYATSHIDGEYSFSCLCKSKNCRKIIKGTDYRELKKLQERYGSHVMRHVLRTIK